MNPSENDIALIQACINNDRKAQELLYRNYYRAMMTLCLNYTKNETDAMDVLNKGFYKIFKNISRYDPGVSALYTWIRTIIINTCLDHIRKSQKENVVQELSTAVVVDIEPEVIMKIKAEAILDLIRQLPPATQAVFNLYVTEGYNHKEIGALMNISEGTSKWHLSEARKTLQRLLTSTTVQP